MPSSFSRNSGTVLFLVLAWPASAFAQAAPTAMADDSDSSSLEEQSRLEQKLAERDAALRAEWEAKAAKQREEQAVASALQQQEIDALREQLETRELEWEGAQAEQAETENNRLRVYGFYDIVFHRYFFPENSPYELYLKNASSFLLSNVNLFVAAQMTPSLSSLVELSFSFAPYGEEYDYEGYLDGASVGHQYKTIDAEEGHRSRDLFTIETEQWGGVKLERAHLTYQPRQWLGFLAGYFLTPFGIWNVEHASTVVLPVRVPYMQLREIIPTTQLGVQIFGRVFPATQLSFNYALTLSNGQGAMAFRHDLDDNKAVGLRLAATYDSSEVTASVGGYGYLGKFTRTSKALYLSSEDAAFEVDEYPNGVWNTRGVSFDLMFAFWGIRFQFEAYIVENIMESPQPLASDDVATVTGDISSLIGQEPTYFTPSNLGRAYYGLLGYTLPLQKWLAPVLITPYVMFEDTQGSDVLKTEAFRILATGINVRPSPFLVLKAEFMYGWPRVEIYGANLKNIAAQVAINF